MHLLASERPTAATPTAVPILWHSPLHTTNVRRFGSIASCQESTHLQRWSRRCVLAALPNAFTNAGVEEAKGEPMYCPSSHALAIHALSACESPVQLWHAVTTAAGQTSKLDHGAVPTSLLIGLLVHPGTHCCMASEPLSVKLRMGWMSFFFEFVTAPPSPPPPPPPPKGKSLFITCDWIRPCTFPSLEKLHKLRVATSFHCLQGAEHSAADLAGYAVQFSAASNALAKRTSKFVS